MPLHRDIYWVGRQWAVTGYGLQAVDQKQKSKFDIEIARLWDDDLVEGLSAERWFNLADFSEGLAIARARYPAQPQRSASKDNFKDNPKPKPLPPEARRQAQPRSEPRKPAPQADPAQTTAATFAMRVEGGSARFTTMWRVRIKR